MIVAVSHPLFSVPRAWKRETFVQFDKETNSQRGHEVSGLVLEDSGGVGDYWGFNGVFHDQNWFLYDKVTVLESEKRAWESSPEAQAIREALNPWRDEDAKPGKTS